MPLLSGGALGPMVQQQELLRRKREFGIGFAGIVRELYLVGAVQNFHYRTHLPSHQAMPRQIAKQGNDIQKVRFSIHDSLATAGNNS
jgi:hypothetical protein